MKTNNFANLKKHILSLSVERIDFDKAKKEWELDEVVITEGFDQCPCGKKDIKEHCYLKNKLNGKQTFVGNVCVRQFMEINVGQLFQSLKRIQKNDKAKPNKGLIDYAMKKGHLYGDNEYKFLNDILKKRNLSEDWLMKISRRILLQIVVQRLVARND